MNVAEWHDARGVVDRERINKADGKDVQLVCQPSRRLTCEAEQSRKFAGSECSNDQSGEKEQRAFRFNTSTSPLETIQILISHQL